MKRLGTFLMAAIVVLSLAGCGARRSQAYYDQPSKVLSANYDGTYVIRAQVRARNSALAFTDVQRKVVREVIFDGVAAGSNGVQDLKPLVFDKNAREKYEDYFNAFFADKGAYSQFASLKDRRILSSDWNRNKMQVLAQVSVTVDRAALKKKLIEDNILKTE